ncbi:[protein-PII] uridylyltransferase [Candidatus Endobugula sertula]|uniref:Bifunctional uridylyltransferase/uridylyl-removing enzyme n=1 Tax=Candidatus Endobugula sertula TaxID=62101 RepID=A0A1D2QQU8_9GAMM|nr:[protein-PII] uridylyltransferase [Candidatus Endobugula sertula]
MPSYQELPLFRKPVFGFDERSFRSALLSTKVVITCFKDAYVAINHQLDMRFREGEGVRNLIYERARMIDCLLHYAWHQFSWQEDIALIAVGGYGRGELHPKSDIDILILMEEHHNEHHVKNIRGLLTLLWDIGLDIGHSVRTLAECINLATQDITVATNLIESRILQGSEHLLNTLEIAITPDNMWANDEFFLAKVNEQRLRHKKYNNTEYNLEPNVKNAPGGLRDIQTIQWVAKRFFHIRTLQELNGTGFFADKELAILTDGEEFLWRVRYGLHLLAKRPEERLLFDYQKELAELFGYKDNEESLAIEQFMHQYYRIVLSLRALNDVLLQFLDEATLKRSLSNNITPINSRFQICNNYIEITNPNIFKETPSALLEIFVLLARNHKIMGIRAWTIRLMHEHRYLIDKAFRKNPDNNRLFIELLNAPYRLVTQLKRMVRYGILGRYLPEFGHIIGQMQHDLFHRYTVDAHTLNVIRFMRIFLSKKDINRFPIASQIITQLPNLKLLYTAGLYHDIGKGRGGDHSILGAEDAFTFCQQHQFTNREAKFAAWLVKNHLLMSSVSQKQDLSDPEVIHEFALKMGDQMHLDYLYVLTVADMNATNPDIWNSWRASLLRELYLQTKRALNRGLEHPVDKQELINDTQQTAMEQLLKNKKVSEQAAWELWQTTGDDYFLQETAEDIVWHTEAILYSEQTDKPLILIDDQYIQNEKVITKLFIRAKSTYNVFAAATTTLDQLNLNIQSARIYSTMSGYTMDTFYVLDQEEKTFGDNTDITEKVITTLIEEFNLINNYSDIIKRRTPRQLKYFSSPTRTSIHNDTTKEQTILEVISPDRPGLLARLARIFVEYDIALMTAKITTLGERVEDIFFITDSNSNRLSDPLICEQLQQSICTQLDAQTIDH